MTSAGVSNTGHVSPDLTILSPKYQRDGNQNSGFQTLRRASQSQAGLGGGGGGPPEEESGLGNILGVKAKPKATFPSSTTTSPSQRGGYAYCCPEIIKHECILTEPASEPLCCGFWGAQRQRQLWEICSAWLEPGILWAEPVSVQSFELP